MVEEIYKILFLQNNPKEALERLRILKNKGKSEDLEHYNLLRAFSLIFMDDLKGALVLTGSINLPEVKVLEAIVNIKSLSFREGIAKLEEYVREGENIYIKAEALYRQGQLYILLNDLKSAKQKYEELLEFSILNDLQAFRWMNEITRARITLSQTGDIDRTIAILEPAEKGLRESGNINRRIIAQILLAYNEAIRGNSRKAQDHLKDAYSLSMLSGSNLIQGLVLYYECIIKRLWGNPDMEICNRSMNLIELSSDEVLKTEARIDRIYHLIRENRLTEAESAILELMDRLENTEFAFKIPLLTYYLAETKLQKGELDETIEIVNRYEEEYGDNRPFLYTTMLHLKTSALYRKGMEDEALRIFYITVNLTQDKGIKKYWSHAVDDLLDKLHRVLKMYLEREKAAPPYMIKLLLEGKFLDSMNDIRIDLDRAMDFLDLKTVERNLSTLEKIDPQFREKYSRRIQYKVNMLGTFRISIGNKVLMEKDFERPIYARVLKYLLINRNRLIEREKLIEDLWGDKRSDSTTRTLNTILSNLRKLLHPLGEEHITIKSGKKNVGLFTDERFTIDIQEFEDRVRKGRIAYFLRNKQDAKALLQEAIEMYSGDLLPSDLYDDWIERERERLKNLYISALTIFTRIMKEEGFSNLAISVLEEALYRYPEREIYEALMELLSENGQKERMEYWENYIEKVLFQS